MDLLPQEGSIDHVFMPQNDGQEFPIVYLIQDAHENLDAQENIYKILKNLVEKENVRLICFEGGSTELDKNFYTFSQQPVLNRQVLDELYKQGDICAFEKFALDTPDNARFLGIENQKIYFDNIHAMQQVYAKEENVQDVIGQIDTIFSRLRGRLFSQELKKIDDAKRMFNSEQITLLRYAGELSKWAKQLDVADLNDIQNQDAWPELVRLVKLIEIEEALEKNKAEVEKDLEWIKAQTAQSSVGFVWDLAQHGIVKGHIRWYFERMADELSARKIPFNQHKALMDWIGVQILQDELDGVMLMDEVARMGKRLLEKLNPSEQVKNLLELERRWEISKRLMRMAINREDWNELSRNADFFVPEQLVDQISDLSREVFGTEGSFDSEEMRNLESCFQSALRNYKIVGQRDSVLYENALAQIQQPGVSKAVMVVGGFHTSYLEPLFQKNKIGYVVITPAIQDLNHKFNYRAQIDPGLDRKRESSGLKNKNTHQPVTGALTGPEARPFQEALFSKARPVLKSVEEKATALSLGQAPETQKIPQAAPVSAPGVPGTASIFRQFTKSLFSAMALTALLGLTACATQEGIQKPQAAPVVGGPAEKNSPIIGVPVLGVTPESQITDPAAVELLHPKIISETPAPPVPGRIELDIKTPLIPGKTNFPEQISPAVTSGKIALNPVITAVSGVTNLTESVLTVRRGDESSWIILNLGRVAGPEGSVMRDSPFFAFNAGVDKDVMGDPTFKVGEQMTLSSFYLVGEKSGRGGAEFSDPNQRIVETSLFYLTNYLGFAKAYALDSKADWIAAVGAGSYLNLRTISPAAPAEMTVSGMLQRYLTDQTLLEISVAQGFEVNTSPYSTGSILQLEIVPRQLSIRGAYQSKLIDNYLELRLEPFAEYWQEKIVAGLESRIIFEQTGLSATARYSRVFSRHPLVQGGAEFALGIHYSANPANPISIYGDVRYSEKDNLAIVFGLEFPLGGPSQHRFIPEPGGYSPAPLSRPVPVSVLQHVKVDTRVDDIPKADAARYADSAFQNQKNNYERRLQDMVNKENLIRDQWLEFNSQYHSGRKTLEYSAYLAQFRNYENQSRSAEDESKRLQKEYLNFLEPVQFSSERGKLLQIKRLIQTNENNPQGFFNGLREIIKNTDDLSLLATYIGGRLSKYHYDESYLSKVPIARTPFNADIASWGEMLPLMSESLVDGKKRPRIHSRSGPQLMAQMINAVGLSGVRAYPVGVSVPGENSITPSAHGVVLTRTAGGFMITDWGHGIQTGTQDIQKAFDIYQRVEGVPGLSHVVADDKGKILFYVPSAEGKQIEKVGTALQGRTLEEANRDLMRRAAENARRGVSGKSLGAVLPPLEITPLEMEVFKGNVKIDRQMLYGGYGNSLGAVFVIMSATARIIGLDLKKYFPVLYKAIFDYQINLLTKKAGTQVQQFLKDLAQENVFADFMGYLNSKQPALVVTGPVSPEALLLQLAGNTTLIIYYEDPAFKQQLDKTAQAMIGKGSITPEKFEKNVYTINLAKAGYSSEQDFLESLLQGKSISFDQRRRSLNWMKKSMKFNVSNQVTWLADNQVVSDVLAEVPVRTELPLVRQDLKLPSKEDQTYLDMLRMALAVRLSQDPEAEKKSGFVRMENNRFVITEYFLQAFLNSIFLKQRSKKLISTMA
ncbi:MAG: hypothetical protein HZC17_02635 [Candidatus Omnitrophica bacterium]|nr:hypothetical protein [Candidatus Omnitrophota bacterium]